MGGKIRATVRPGLHHGSHDGGEVIEVTQDELASFGDKFLTPPVDATPEAWAMGLSVDAMRFVEGTGKDGRILKKDVEAALGDAE